jgi:hypothetical protein
MITHFWSQGDPIPPIREDFVRIREDFMEIFTAVPL